jgi:gamma-glutamyl:cysteine ligase YbdK (ATP-grasp superfamily)
VSRRPLGLFAAFGVELEYMIVDRATFDVLPMADRVLHAVAGDWSGEADTGELGWSNELCLHVLELKTNGPAERLLGLPQLFARDIRRIDDILAEHGGRLMPGAMHPWMDPWREMRLWPHDSSPVYAAFDRIFDCRGHGWANLQSAHLNLPFAGAAEFGRLHAAIRLLLPLLPALAASSPVRDGAVTGLLDTRLEVYKDNCSRVPSLTGRVIPEPVFTPEDYESDILQRLYADIAPHDPEGVLRYEWLNARGAIARFDRDAIEIRVLDVQECPQADLAIHAAIVHVLRQLVAERPCSLAEQMAFGVEPLAALLTDVVRDADRARVADVAYLRALGWNGGPCRAGELWQHLLDRFLADPAHAEWQPPLRTILEQGPLARRILDGLPHGADRRDLARLYGELCDCLRHGRMLGAR